MKTAGAATYEGPSGRKWAMQFELRLSGLPSRIISEVIPGAYKYEGAAKIAAKAELKRRYPTAAELLDVFPSHAPAVEVVETARKVDSQASITDTLSRTGVQDGD